MERYEYDAVLQETPDNGGAYVVFPWDIRQAFGKGRLKVHALFDGVPYDGSVVNMGLKNADGSVCYIIGVLKAIRKQLRKSGGDTIHVVIEPVRAGAEEKKSMPSGRGKEWTFDTVADVYEKIRPGYPEELYRALFAYCPLDKGSRAVEVGIGGGQATLPVLKTGCAVTAVEYGKKLARLCGEKFGAWPGFSVITGRFEQAPLPEGAFDLVYAATAFHWIPEETGYPKVFRLLKPGGAFARFANHPYPSQHDPVLSEAVQAVYARYYYPYYKKQPEKKHPYTVEQAAEIAAAAEKFGFTDVRYEVFARSRVLSAAEYRLLLGTYSDHIAMEESVREKFFDAVADTIVRHGGSITIDDTIDLQLARKPKNGGMDDETQLS